MIHYQDQILQLSGPLTITQIGLLSKQLATMAFDDQVLKVDLSAVTAFDSSGLALLMTFQQQLGYALTFVGMPETARVLLDLYNLSSQLKLEEVMG